MEPECLLSCSPGSATALYPKPDGSSPYLPTLYP